MTIEAKFTAGPLAEDDKWTTPIATLAEQILNTPDAVGELPTGVSVQWEEGDEVTYRRVGTEEIQGREDEAWLEGFVFGTQVDDDEAVTVTNNYFENDEHEDLIQVGWVHSDSLGDIFEPLGRAEFVENNASGWHWEPVYKVAEGN